MARNIAAPDTAVRSLFPEAIMADETRKPTRDTTDPKKDETTQKDLPTPETGAKEADQVKGGVFQKTSMDYGET
jgi:hypothetical protein